MQTRKVSHDISIYKMQRLRDTLTGNHHTLMQHITQYWKSVIRYFCLQNKIYEITRKKMMKMQKDELNKVVKPHCGHRNCILKRSTLI